MRNVLFLDIDGTLLSHKTFTVPRSAEDAVRKARKKGAVVFLCTGRSLCMTRGILDPSLYDGTVFCNGAAVQLNGKLEMEKPVDPSVVKHTIQSAERNHCAVSLMSSEVFFRNAMDMEVWKTRMEHFKVIDTAFRNVLNHALSADQLHGEPIYKMDIRYISESDADGFEKELDPSLYMIHMLSEDGNSAGGGEITRTGATKGNAVRELMETRYGGYQSYGFGDSLNDLDLIQACDVGAAMGNAVQELKETADFVTGDIEEDGLAQAFHDLSLI